MLRAVPSWSPSVADLSVFLIGSWGVGAGLAALAVAIRIGVQITFLQLRTPELLWGAFDGAVLGSFVLWLMSPTWLESLARQLAFFVMCTVAGSVLGSALRGSIRRLFSALAALGTGCLLVWAFEPYGDVWARITLQAVMLVAVAGCISVHHLPLAFLRFAMALALIAAYGMANHLEHAPGARSALALRSIHARTWVEAINRIVDHDRDRATNLFGGRDCDPSNGLIYPGATELMENGRDDNCQGGDGIHAPPPTRSRLHGVAKGRDIFILSLDSLRFDVVDQLEETRAVLGPHVHLTHAVSPTPKTVTSIASMLRGHPSRQLNLERVAGVRNLVPKRHLTLGKVLTGAGYRAITVPTHRYLNRRGRVLEGFDELQPSASELAARFVRAPSAIELVTSALRRSHAPTCVFLHFMESHHPYRYGGMTGPDSFEGLRNAVRYVDRAIADMIVQVTKTRGQAPVVAILGDHGEEFLEHGGRFHATTVYSEQVRVTFLLAAPNLRGGTFSAPVSTAALPATILDLAGIQVPVSMTEPSLLPYLSGEAPAPAIAVSEVRAGLNAIAYTFGSYRLITDATRSSEFLFSIDTDPFETYDQSDRRPGVLRELRARAREWDEQH